MHVPLPAALTNNTRERDDRVRVLADQVELLYRQAPLGIVVTLVIGAVLAFELYSSAKIGELVILWGMLSAFVCGALYFLVLAYRHTQTRDSAPDVWLRRYAIGTFGSGVVWGFAGAVFFPGNTDEQQVFLAFVLAGMSAGGLPLFSAVWWVYALFAAGLMLPFEVVLLTFGIRLFTELSFMIPVFFLINVSVAYRLNQVFVSGYRLRVSYGRLTEDYTAMNQRLERQLIELEEARSQVEASGRKLALFAARAPIAVIELDIEGRIQQVNQEAENLFGYPAAELIDSGASIKTLVLPEFHAEFDANWARLLQTRESLAGLKIRNPRRDGIEIVCEWTVTPLVNPQGTMISIIAQGRDITKQLEADRLKQEFTSTLSHELRTPLTSIIGSLQLVNAGVLGELNSDQQELTEVAERNGQRLLDLINDILDIEKIQSGKFTLFPEPMPLDELVGESMQLNQAFADRYHVKLTTIGSMPKTLVNADHKRLLQVMTNLISNAAKFSPEGGSVEIEMHEREGRVRVSIGDRGTGIPENFRNRIFGRFAQADSTDTRAKGGTGLGLAICKRLIELMGGSIGYSDRAGGGSSFWFEMPVHPAGL
ncbi:MAG: HAMP domain-containing histidine kinase [Betaproteobacteria bacterium]|nr:HAMP domain-containing histidine kinase [Betaproteobacteria bacterium]